MIQNRETFLKAVAQKLGREVKTECDAYPKPVNDYSSTRFTELSQDELFEMFINASKAMYAKVTVTNEAEFLNALKETIDLYGESVLVARDDRLDTLGATKLVLDNYKDAKVFDKTRPDEMREYSLKAKTSIVHADYGIADIGFVTMHSTEDLARVVSLLPENNIIVLRKSQILPRVAQFAKLLDERVEAGERLPSVINVNGGPSSTADIELVKCIGVHGPMVAHYLVIED